MGQVPLREVDYRAVKLIKRNFSSLDVAAPLTARQARNGCTVAEVLIFLCSCCSVLVLHAVLLVLLSSCCCEISQTTRLKKARRQIVYSLALAIRVFRICLSVAGFPDKDWLTSTFTHDIRERFQIWRAYHESLLTVYITAVRNAMLWVSPLVQVRTGLLSNISERLTHYLWQISITNEEMHSQGVCAWTDGLLHLCS